MSTHDNVTTEVRHADAKPAAGACAQQVQQGHRQGNQQQQQQGLKGQQHEGLGRTTQTGSMEQPGSMKQTQAVSGMRRAKQIAKRSGPKCPAISKGACANQQAT